MVKFECYSCHPEYSPCRYEDEFFNIDEDEMPTTCPKDDHAEVYADWTIPRSEMDKWKSEHKKGQQSLPP